jgi:hypothetical protein
LCDFQIKFCIFSKYFDQWGLFSKYVAQKYPLLRARRRQGYFFKIFGKHTPGQRLGLGPSDGWVGLLCCFFTSFFIGMSLVNRTRYLLDFAWCLAALSAVRETSRNPAQGEVRGLKESNLWTSVLRDPSSPQSKEKSPVPVPVQSPVQL